MGRERKKIYMAGDVSQDNSNQSNSVQFNEGEYKINRTNGIQQMINISKINPTTFNAEYNLWNYQLWFNCVNILLDEIWTKLESEEQTKTQELREKMIELVSKYVVTEKKSVNSYSEQAYSVVNKQKWGKLYLALIKYDNFVRELMGQYGWDNPKVDCDYIHKY